MDDEFPIKFISMLYDRNMNLKSIFYRKRLPLTIINKTVYVLHGPYQEFVFAAQGPFPKPPMCSLFKKATGQFSSPY